MAPASLLFLPPLDRLLDTEAALVLAIAVLAVVVGMGAVTMIIAITRFREDRRRVAAREELRAGLLQRLNRDDPDWRAWTADFDALERDVCREHLEEYLAMVQGDDREKLMDLADVLGIRSAALEQLDEGGHLERCRALHRLALLGEPVDPTWLVERLGPTQVEREAAIEVLALNDTELARRTATDLLLTGEFLTVYGVHSLYQLLEHDPDEAFDLVDAISIERPDLLAQVLLVLTHLRMDDEAVPLDDIAAWTDHPRPDIRARCCGILEGHGWRDDVRDRVDVGELLRDPVTSVRMAAYRMLGGWGDDRARDLLRGAATTEPDPYARIVLYRQFDRLHDPIRTDELPDGGDPVTALWAGVEGIAQLRTDPLL